MSLQHTRGGGIDDKVDYADDDDIVDMDMHVFFFFFFGKIFKKIKLLTFEFNIFSRTFDFVKIFHFF